MIKNRRLWEKFERKLREKERVDIEKNFLIFEELLKFALTMNKFSQKDWREDIKKDIKYAQVINGVKKSNQKNCQRI